MASLIKALLRLRPAKGFGEKVPQARKRRADKSLRRDKAIAKARRAEAKALKLVARATSQLKLAADTQSARENQARRRAMAKAAAEAKAKAAAEAKKVADAKAAAIAKAKSTLVLKAERLERTRALVQDLRKGVAALKEAKKNKNTLVPRAKRLARTKALVDNLRKGIKARATARRRAATLVKRSKDFFKEVVIARPVRVCGVAGTGRK